LPFDEDNILVIYDIDEEEFNSEEDFKEIQKYVQFKETYMRAQR